MRWAAYLGSSWTWCIGMFLPVLLIRDYGTLGFVAFAVPNVIGAAAMGWTLRGEDASRRMVGAHARVMRLFSHVTVGFQLFFLLALGSMLMGQTLAIGLAALVFVVVGVMSWTEKGTGFGGGWTGLVVWGFSIAMGVLASESHLLQTAPLTSFIAPSSMPDVIWLGLSCVFGFALCPYLDLTFHKAWRGAGDRRREAFGLGFGFFFLAMIAFTAMYSGAVREVLASPGGGAALLPIWLHMTGQIAFTCVVHSRGKLQSWFELPERSGKEAENPGARWSRMDWAELLGVVGIVGVGFFESRSEGFELVYRLFMSFYGLLFPAYVLICMMPTWRNPLPPTHRQVLAWIVSVVVASPMMYLAFIEKRMWWVGPALVVVFVASRVRAGYRAPQAVASLIDVEAPASGRDSADPSEVKRQ